MPRYMNVKLDMVYYESKQDMAVPWLLSRSNKEKILTIVPLNLHWALSRAYFVFSYTEQINIAKAVGNLFEYI